MDIDMDFGDNFTLTSTGLLITGEPDFDSWRRIGPKLFALARASSWGIGDWWAVGEQRYGARTAEAVARGQNPKTLMNKASVARAFETSRRREALTFGHHEAVVTFAAEDQDRLLDQAIVGGWSVRRIRAAVKSVSLSSRADRAGEDDGSRMNRAILREFRSLPIKERPSAVARAQAFVDRLARRWPLLDDAELHELRRIAAELDEFPFVKRTWNWIDGRLDGNAAGGHANVVGGCGGASVYRDIIGGSGRATRSDVLLAVRRLIAGIACTPLGERALEVARLRLRGDRSVSRPWLPPEAGDTPEHGFQHHGCGDVEPRAEVGVER
jgi:hypothetical protein